MNNNMIQNPKTEVPNTPEMNDKDYLNAMLESTKNIVNNYSYALNEASNDTLYETIKTIFDETSRVQRGLYNLAFQHGWYSIEKAEIQKISQKFNEYQQEISQLPVQNQ